MEKKRPLEKKKLEKIGDYTIYTVNASAVRDMSQADDEFNHFGTHLDFPNLVPKDEIWISHDISAHERQFLIHNGISQYEGKRKGKKNYYEYAEKKEKAEREKVDGLKFKPNAHNETPPDKVYYKYYCGIPTEGDDIEVWLVNGEIVRDLYKTDFIEGANGEIYSWTPRQEIWIEKNLMRDEGEVDITILHEYVESTLMRYKKMSYNKAHVIAAKVDWHHRRKWKIEDVKALNREEALKMAEPYL
jgi:hypothetical protein